MPFAVCVSGEKVKLVSHGIRRFVFVPASSSFCVSVAWGRSMRLVRGEMAKMCVTVSQRRRVAFVCDVHALFYVALLCTDRAREACVYWWGCGTCRCVCAQKSIKGFRGPRARLKKREGVGNAAPTLAASRSKIT